MQKFSMDDKTSSKDFNGATFLLKLPTKGLYYPEGHPFHDKETIEIKMMTTKEEEILTNVSYNENEVVMDKLLESVVVADNFSPKDIFETDQLAIIIGSRIDAYGEEYPAIINCESCEKDYQVTIDLDKMLENVDDSEVELTAKNTLIVELPKSKKVVEYKVLLPSEAASIDRTVEKMQKMNIKASVTTEFYKRIIVSVDGDTSRDEINKFISELRIMDSRFLAAKYSKSLPMLNTTFSSTCSHCSHEQEGGMPIQANFFFPEL